MSITIAELWLAGIAPLALLNADARTQVVGRRFEGNKGEQSAGGGGLGLSLRQEFHPAVFWLAQAEQVRQANQPRP